MLGRKQSLKGDLILADYGPEESLNENADIEWVNKVSDVFKLKTSNYISKSQIFKYIIYEKRRNIYESYEKYL